MRFIKVIIIVCCGLQMVAQQDAMYTHYSFNTLAVNPGYAGSRDVTTVTGLHRSQWVGFDGAPVTQTLTLHSPVYRENIGLGLSLINDNIGPINVFSIYADLAFRFNVTSKTRISLGVKGGGSLLQGRLSEVNLQSADFKFANLQSNFLPNFGTGIYVDNRNWYVGLSAPKLLENIFSNNLVSSLDGEDRHYYLIGGLITRINRNVKFRPTAYIKAAESAPIEGDLTALFVIREKLELGGMIRTGDGFGALIGYNFSPQMRVGYSFDWSLVNLTGVHNAGSHEVMMRYDIITVEKKNIHSPRYF